MNSVMTPAPVAAPDFGLIFEAMCGPNLILDPELNIVAASDAYVLASGIRREALLGKSIFELFPDSPGDADAAGVGNLRRSLERVREHLVADAMAVQKYDLCSPEAGERAREERYWGATNRPVLDDGGHLRYIVHQIEDMTSLIRSRDEKPAVAGMAAPPLARDQQSLELYLRSQEAAEARRQLQKAKAEITATNRDLENFSYSISHDLRAPLRAIDGFSRLLGERMQGRMDAEDQRLLAVIRSSSKTMGQLIDDLLHYSRVNRAQLRLARVDMKALIERLWPGVANGFSGALQIGELPWATCDAALIGLVWENLLENAVKFTGKTPDPQIKISGETDDLGSVYHIRDNGAGFDMRFLDKLFNVFQRLHNASEFPGTGIGLAIVSRIILHHGGRVWAEGVPGKGACFHFTLPDPEKSAEGGTPHATR